MGSLSTRKYQTIFQKAGADSPEILPEFSKNLVKDLEKLWKDLGAKIDHVKLLIHTNTAEITKTSQALNQVSSINESDLAGKANIVHTHTIADIINLLESLGVAIETNSANKTENQPTINFIDTADIKFTVTPDAENNRINIRAYLSATPITEKVGKADEDTMDDDKVMG